MRLVSARKEISDSPIELLPGLVQALDASGRYCLMGSRCPGCGAWSSPAVQRCTHCREQPASVRVGTSGTLYTYTVVRTRAPFGLPEPYAVGYVDLDESGLRVFGLIDPRAIGELEVGQRMDIGLRPLGVDGQGRPCLRPVFYPATLGERA